MFKFTALSALLFATSILASAPATAAPLFFDDFTQEAYGTNTALDNWTISDGTIDVVGDPGFFAGLCTGGPSPDKCVDLDGSSFDAGRITSTGIALEPGTYEFSFWLKGNSRGGSADTVRMIVETGVTAGESFTLDPVDAWQQYTRLFTLQSAQTVNLVFDHSGGDNIGILLDNVSLSTVPEPATLCLFGLALAGACARRRRSPRR